MVNDMLMLCCQGAAKSFWLAGILFKHFKIQWKLLPCDCNSKDLLFKAK